MKKKEKDEKNTKSNSHELFSRIIDNEINTNIRYQSLMTRRKTLKFS
jgi:hypothetical protein